MNSYDDDLMFDPNMQDVNVFDDGDMYTDTDISSPDVEIPDAITTIGDPDKSGYVHQTTDHTCAVVSQEMILHEFGIMGQTGEPISEAQLVSEAYSHGWLTEHGTSSEHMGKLLELHGVNVHQGTGVENMINELAQGHMVMVGVDSGELWGTDFPFEDFFGQKPDHAIVVKGIKINETGDAVVVINDPGDPNGAGKEYPIDQFIDAFQDSNFYYVATNEAPPTFEPFDNSILSAYINNPGTLSQNSSYLETHEMDNDLLFSSPDALNEEERDKLLFET